MKYDVKVLFVSRWNFKNDDTGEVVKGCKVTFMMLDDTDDENHYGRKIYTGVLPYEKYDEIKSKKLPLTCKAEYEQVSLDAKPKFIGLEY